jgi:hypothetical protein
MERLSVNEREKLLHGLHGYMAWVGAEIPDVFEIDGTEIPLHELVWRLINKKELTEPETVGIESLIRALEEKETCDETTLAKETITREEAECLYKEASGLLRAIMDLKGIGNGCRGTFSVVEMVLYFAREVDRRTVEFDGCVRMQKK